jgi:hypothetical protein
VGDVDDVNGSNDDNASLNNHDVNNDKDVVDENDRR